MAHLSSIEGMALSPHQSAATAAYPALEPLASSSLPCPPTAAACGASSVYLTARAGRDRAAGVMRRSHWFQAPEDRVPGKGGKQAARGFRFDFPAEGRVACLKRDRVRGVPQRGRPFDENSIGIQHTANLCRKTEADENGNRLSEHVGFHRSLLLRRAPAISR